jgi:hypothetical protein
MATARLHPLPLLVIDFFMLTQILTAGTPGKISDDSFMPIVDRNGSRVAAGSALPVSGPGHGFPFDTASLLVLAADEKSGDTSAPGRGDSKSAPSAAKTSKSEQPNVASPTLKAPAPGKSAATARTPAKPVEPAEKSLEPELPDGKSPSILQMLEGHEKELLVAAAIALAFFIVGWICGGNYYLRRDRRRRTKLRF